MVDIDPEDPPADTMWERAGESELKIRFLVAMNRWFVTAVLSLSGFGILVVLGRFGPLTTDRVLSGTGVVSVFGSAIIAVVTSVTLVLSVSQFVLSGQLSGMFDLRRQMDSEEEFRDIIEGYADVEVTPVQPSGFFSLLLRLVEDRAAELDAIVAETDGEHSAVRTYTDSVLEHSEKSREQVEDSEFGSFDVLLPVLNFDYSWKLQAAQLLLENHREELPDEAVETLEELTEIFRLFAPAREFFKNHYFRWEVIDTARTTLFSAIPALSIAVYMVFVFDPTALTGFVLGIPISYLAVSTAFVVAVVPFTILLAYILRILTVLKRTLVIGPFILRDSEAVGRSQETD